jgi:hypothetical protein
MCMLLNTMTRSESPHRPRCIGFTPLPGESQITCEIQWWDWWEYWQDIPLNESHKWRFPTNCTFACSTQIRYRP